MLGQSWANAGPKLGKCWAGAEPILSLPERSQTLRAPYTELYLHCVWATWDRLPLITPDIEEQIYASIAAKCNDLNCYVLAIGGVTDHVHLLVRFPTTLSVSTLAGEAKGASSHL